MQEIVINVHDLKTETCCDILQVYDGADENAPLLEQLSGTRANIQIRSTGRFMYLRFQSDRSVNGPGFILSHDGENFCLYITHTFSTLVKHSTIISYL